MQVPQKEKPAFWPAARVRRKFGAAKGGGELRRGGSADPEHWKPEGWSGPTARGTQKERHAYSVSFFLVDLIGFEPTTPTMRKVI